jgi:hypothetical protein
VQYHRHETFVVKAPPIIGPHARPSWPIPMIPIISGRLCSGKMLATVVMVPVNRPEDPDGAAHDKHRRRLCRAAQGRPELKDEEEDEEGPLRES